MDELTSSENLRKFAAFVRAAPASPEAEKFVREMLARCARSCPVGVLVRLGETLADCRRDELRGEVESN